ncbi:MAG: type II toxin-antitoxin system VapC family toxin [Oscillospiraceae bacterium]|nr:type II toxin-antitoxin system VapC family toxin [Oscillospiraceae bacterium]
MKLLLDTQIVLWFLNGEKLSEKIQTIIQDGDNYVSVVSLWEVAIKMNINKLSFDGGFIAFRKLIEDNGFKIIPVKDEHMNGLFALPLYHRDPFDRLLIATALAENMTILTADSDIKKYDVPCLW